MYIYHLRLTRNLRRIAAFFNKKCISLMNTLTCFYGSDAFSCRFEVELACLARHLSALAANILMRCMTRPLEAVYVSDISMVPLLERFTDGLELLHPQFEHPVRRGRNPPSSSGKTTFFALFSTA